MRLRGACLALLPLVTSLAACQDLSPLERDVCGNRVTEPDAGEDCDGQDGCGAPGQAAACRYTCDEGPCPAGMGCGVDGVCRAPTARFTSILAETTPTSRDYQAGDVDQDGCVELLRTGRHGVVLHAFESWTPGACSPAETSFDLQRHGLEDPPLPAPLLADVSGDGRLDLLAPADGPAGLGTGLLLAHGASGPSLFPQVEPLVHLEQQNTRLSRARLQGADALIVFAGEPGLAPSGPPMQVGAGACGGPLAPAGQSELLVARQPSERPASVGSIAGVVDALAAVVAADLDGDPLDDCEELVVAFSGETALRPMRLCDGGDVSLEALAPVAFPPGASVRPRKQSVLALDVDGDGHLDLVANATDGALHVAYGLGDGRFHSQPGPTASPDQQTGVLSVDPALAGQVSIVAATGPAVDDLVGIACPDSSPFTSPVCPPVTAPCQALVVDVDADGDLDVVSVEGQQPGVTVRRQLASGAFHTTVLETRCIPSRLATGDFDGDGVVDVAFFDQSTNDDGTSESELSVAYGQAFAPPLAPIPQGRFPGATDLVGGAFGGGTLGGGGLDRLHASRGIPCAPSGGPPPPGGADLALLEGRAERVLIAPAYFPPPSGSPSLTTPLTLGPLVVGNLSPSGPAVGLLSRDLSGAAPDGLWLYEDRDGSLAGQLPLQGLPPCDEDCVVVPVPRTGGLDDLLFLGAGAWLYSLDGATQELDSGHDFVAREGGPPYRFTPRPLVLDLDADGLLDVVARATTGELVAFWGAGTSFEATTLFAPSCPTMTPCGPLALAVLDLDGDGALELVLAQGDELTVHHLDVATRLPGPGEPLDVERATPPPKGGMLPAFHDFTALAAGDFDGDGVTDLVLASSSSYFELLRGEPVRP